MRCPVRRSCNWNGAPHDARLSSSRHAARGWSRALSDPTRPTTMLRTTLRLAFAATTCLAAPAFAHADPARHRDADRIERRPGRRSVGSDRDARERTAGQRARRHRVGTRMGRRQYVHRRARPRTQCDAVQQRGRRHRLVHRALRDRADESRGERKGRVAAVHADADARRDDAAVESDAVDLRHRRRPRQQDRRHAARVGCAVGQHGGEELLHRTVRQLRRGHVGQRERRPPRPGRHARSPTMARACSCPTSTARTSTSSIARPAAASARTRCRPTSTSRR